MAQTVDRKTSSMNDDSKDKSLEPPQFV